MKKKSSDYTLKDFVEESIEFKRDSTTFQDRIGDPDELSSVIGKVSLAFQRLEDVLSTYIIVMLDIEFEKGKIVIAEQSFSNKVNMFSSLFHLLKDKKDFNVGKFDKKEFFQELKKAIFKCQELRNQVIHSSFLQNYKTDFKIFQHKYTAKSKKGLLEKLEEVDIPYIFNIADHIIAISMEVENFFYGFQSKIEISERMDNKLSHIYKYRV